MAAVGVAAADVDAHGAGPAVPVRGGERAGLGVPAAGREPGGGAAVLCGAPGACAGAGRAGAVQRVRRALVRGGLPASVHLAARGRAATLLPAAPPGPGAAAPGPPGPFPAPPHSPLPTAHPPRPP